MEQDTLAVRYKYEITNKEVESPPKKFCILIPKMDKPVKVVEYKNYKGDESVRVREVVVEL